MAMADTGDRFPCPCCGYLVFSEVPGSYDICPVCFWEDDASQLRFVHTTGANRVNLIEAQGNFVRFGACEPQLRQHVRKPTGDDRLEPGWRPIDKERDNIEEHVSGVNYGATYPDDLTTLYYWRSSYWRTQKT